jgi:hypothetical protein
VRRPTTARVTAQNFDRKLAQPQALRVRIRGSDFGLEIYGMAKKKNKPNVARKIVAPPSKPEPSLWQRLIVLLRLALKAVGTSIRWLFTERQPAVIVLLFLAFAPVYIPKAIDAIHPAPLPLPQSVATAPPMGSVSNEDADSSLGCNSFQHIGASSTSTHAVGIRIEGGCSKFYDTNIKTKGDGIQVTGGRSSFHKTVINRQSQP